MLAEARRQQLLEMVRLRGFAAFPELAEALSVSESTVRRDAELLEACALEVPKVEGDRYFL